MMLAPSEMSSSPAPRRSDTAAASGTTSDASIAMFRKLAVVQNTCPFGESRPKTRIRRSSTIATQKTVLPTRTCQRRIGGRCSIGAGATLTVRVPSAIAVRPVSRNGSTEMAHHHLDDLRHRQALGRAVECDLAAHEHDDAVRNLERAWKVV